MRHPSVVASLRQGNAGVTATSGRGLSEKQGAVRIGAGDPPVCGVDRRRSGRRVNYLNGIQEVRGSTPLAPPIKSASYRLIRRRVGFCARGRGFNGASQKPGQLGKLVRIIGTVFLYCSAAFPTVPTWQPPNASARGQRIRRPKSGHERQRLPVAVRHLVQPGAAPPRSGRGCGSCWSWPWFHRISTM